MNNKTKAIVFGSISIIIIGAIIIIALWPASSESDKGDDGDGDDGDGNMSDSSRLNLVNLHYRITNHTIITTSTMVVFGCIIIILIFAKGYASRHKKRKREKRSQERSRERSAHNSRDFSQAFATNGTWHTDQGWMPRQQMTAQGWAPPAAQAPPPASPRTTGSTSPTE